ncbi:MAG: hypothetical protein DSY37_02795 [Hyperthermus sp.]|nr:MAG: hypothetical protein DSY37_02795 [Hyperthermus sp.]
MKVVLRHEGTWLLVREVYAIRRQRGKRRGRQRQTSAPYGTVAESVDKPPLNGLRYTESIEVPATKVMKFIVKAFQLPGDTTIVVKPLTRESYEAKIYAKTREEAARALAQLARLLSELGRRRGGEEQEQAESEEEEV